MYLTGKPLKLHGNRQQNCNSKFYQKHSKHSISTITEMFISQTVTALVLRGMHILLACSLFKNKLGFLFLDQTWDPFWESLSRFCIKKGK